MPSALSLQAPPLLPHWERFKQLLRLPTMPSLDEHQQEWRIFIFERDIGLLVKAVVLASLFYFFYWSDSPSHTPVSYEMALEEVAWSLAHRIIQYLFMGYLAVNVAVGFLLLGMRQVSRAVVQWTVFGVALIDGLFVGALVVITGGLRSPLFWLFPLLILRNCVSVSAVVPQIGLNLLMCGFFGGGALVEATIAKMDNASEWGASPAEAAAWVLPSELGWSFHLRVLLLVGVAVWSYGLQVLLDRQQRRLEEQNELALRREQLQLSGRLAAEIAHQLKNPLAIINNASYTLQRTVKEGKGTITQQIKIIREEIERSDRLITELMGYAQLVEGRVEKLDVKEELERALLQVFPPAVKFEIAVHRHYAPALPQLLAQRNHLAEVFVNIMQNAREAMNAQGTLWVRAEHGPGHSVIITIADDGPGIPAECLDKVWEPYFTTREKGTGLGLAIVRHNVQLYGGKVQVESELGKGCRFILEFPARTVMRLRR
ncbi:MAG: hypothetical protein FJ387_24725 [Verrucomicrobia bacterium]|nr:hypothetical protein [Verrucomicrobiota bacterium]